MKRQLLTKIMLLLCALVAGSGSVWGSERVYKSLTFTANDNTKVSTYTGSWTETVSGTSWSIANFSNNNWGWASGDLKIIKCGRKKGTESTPSVATITTTSAIDEALTKVVVTLTAINKNDINSIKLYLASNSDFTENLTTISVASIPSAAGDMTIAVPEANRAANRFYKLEFDTKGSTSSNGHTGLTKVDYYADIAVAVETPTFSVAAGTYAFAQNVAISCETDGATIRYTTDGLAPTSSSTEYAGAIPVSSTTTIKARAFKNSDESEVASATYTFVSITHAGTEVDPYTIADARNAIDALDGNKTSVYVKGIVCSDAFGLSNGAMSYWISDDGTETNRFEAFKGKGIDGANFATVTDVQTGDVVVVKGDILKYNSTYELAQDNQLVSIIKKPADPVFDPASGIVAVGSQVAITCATAGTSIYYTTNGDNPTLSSTLYSGPITINSDVTIKAIAVNNALTSLTSTIVSASYTAAAASYSVTLGDDSSVLSEESAGAGVNLPSREDAGSYKFMGWSATNVTAETNVKPAIIFAGLYNPSQNVTLYPVYVRPNYSAASKTGTATISTYASANSWANGTQYTTVNVDENIAATATGGGNTGKYYTNGNDWRFYQNESAKVTIAAAQGHILKTVKFTFTVANTGTLNYDANALESTTAVDVTGSSAEFTVGNSGDATNGQVKITAIEVVYTDACYLSNPENVSVEIPTAGYATYCNATKALSFAGVTAYKVASVSSNGVMLEEISEAPANTPVVLQASAGSYELSVVASASSVGTNLLLVSDGTITGGDNIYALASKGKPAVTGFYKVKKDVIVPAGKCYIAVDVPSGSAPEFLGFNFDETTAIRGIDNGELRMETGVFNLNGQRVAQPSNACHTSTFRLKKGLYIVNGRKVVIK